MSGHGVGIAEMMQDAFTITVSDPAAARHEANIAQALLNVVDPAPAVVPRWKMRIPALIAAAMVVAPAGAAFAAESATPGDMLYPVKRIVEPVVSIFNDDIVAAHRVDELSRMVDEPVDGGKIPAAVSDARDAVAELPPGHALRQQFREIADRIGREDARDRRTTDVDTDSDGTPPDDSSGSREPQRTPTTVHRQDNTPTDRTGSDSLVPDTIIPTPTDMNTDGGAHPTTTSDTRPPQVDEPVPGRSTPSPTDRHDTTRDTTTSDTTHTRSDR